MVALAEQRPPVGEQAGWYPDPLGSKSERYWDGDWTEKVRRAENPGNVLEQVPVVAPSLRTPEERKALLAQRIALLVSQGCRIESQSEFMAVVVTGKKVNHVLHLILTVLTFGLWAIVWIILAIDGGEKRKTLTVDEYGQLALQG